MVQQLFERPKQQCLKFLADHTLTQEHFVAGTKREQQAATFKRRWKTDLVARRVQDNESLKKVAVFQWSNKFQTVLKFFFRFPVECFSKHPQTRHDILNATTLRFEIRFF